MATESSPQDVPTIEESRFSRVVSSFVENKLSVFGFILVLLIIILVVFVPQIIPYSPFEQDYTSVLKPPSIAHPFGTDDLGRDIFTRVLFGYRTVLTITAIGVFMASITGVLFGILAGYAGGRTDDVIMRIVDILMSFPSLILALALISVIGPSKWGVALVLGIAYTPIFARIARSEAVSISKKDFIKNLEVRGINRFQIMVRHILPNEVGELMVAITLQLAFGILTTATLSFLGVGIQPPNPSLGRMLTEGKDYIDTAWWYSIFPGLAIMILVIGFNSIGDGLRDTLDPRQVIR